MAVPPPELKPAVRTRLRAARRAHVAGLSPVARDAAARAAAGHALPLLSGYGLVALYHPLGSELDPWPLAARLHGLGSGLALPVVDDFASPLIYRSWRPGDPLTAGAGGTRHPGRHAAAVIPDAVLVPLLGFTPSGVRLGQGAGCYDRALAGLPGAFRLGYAWAMQRCQTLPIEPWDMPLDAVATETGVDRWPR